MWLQRAKELHPDALQNDCNTADAKAFVQLVRAYEVLRDPYQRKMYDVASDTKLPGVLRQAAAAAAGAEETGSQQGDSTADPLGWRYGFGRWAKHGPSSYSPAVQYDGPALRYSLLNALHKYRMDLEKDLHAGLMTAFLGPELDLLPGQLPSAFEADERAHPSLSHDILHLVHGRELLGVVRVKQALQLTGDVAAPAALGTDSSAQALPAASALDDLMQVSAVSEHIDSHQQGVQQQHQWYGTLEAPAGEQQHTLHDHAAASTGDSRLHCGSAEAAEAGSNTANSSDDEISEEQWQELLLQQHPLHGIHSWAAAATAKPEPATEDARHPTSQSSRLAAEQTAEAVTSGDCMCGAAHKLLVAAPSAGSSDADIHLGGRWHREAWECRQGSHQQQQQHELLAYKQLLQQQVCIGCDVDSDVLRCRPVHASNSIDGTREKRRADPAQQQQQFTSQQDMSSQQSTPACHSSTDWSFHKQWQQDHKQQQRKQQTAWLKRRRLWRWLRSPAADWTAADWSFTDTCAGVLLIEFCHADAKLAALAVRDDTQPGKPIKVYVDGIFVAAVLDDIVMEPLTGQLLAVLYRFYTPGVHHVYFYQPHKRQSRILARLQRRWMPPSSTWLFPPRTDSHDIGGWVIEWEGYKHRQRSGWLHPALYVLVAGCYSIELEAKRLAGASPMWEKAQKFGTRLSQLKHHLQSRWKLPPAATS
eukprot:GHRR01021836.1.p1 GENE.GHRR01021836.1~~GHRR01021836.1.p1  ORF type:complete len:703 (+),score=305.32 GHRR01021836.1:429-2537(+)